MIERYAMSSAEGATFYVEPVAALDGDVFVSTGHEPGSTLMTPKPFSRHVAAPWRVNTSLYQAGGCNFFRRYIEWLKKH